MAGIITSPESVMSTNMITTPDSSISLQSQMSMNEFSSCPPSPLPPIPPLPKDSNLLMPEHFQTVQPDVPPRDDSFNVTAVYSSDPQSIFTEHAITSQVDKIRIIYLALYSMYSSNSYLYLRLFCYLLI